MISGIYKIKNVLLKDINCQGGLNIYDTKPEDDRLNQLCFQLVLFKDKGLCKNDY